MISIDNFIVLIRYQQCQCVSPRYWSARSVLSPVTGQLIEAQLCNASNTCHKNATDRLSASDTLWNEHCSQCAQACSVVDFSVTVSGANTVTDIYASFAKEFVENSGVPLPTNWNTTWLSEIQQNYMSLEITCQSNIVENYTQEASLSAVDVLSNVGGHTGLWIGISFLSIMEFVEMLYRLVRHEIHLMRRKFEQRIN